MSGRYESVADITLRFKVSHDWPWTSPESLLSHLERTFAVPDGAVWYSDAVAKLNEPTELMGIRPPASVPLPYKELEELARNLAKHARQLELQVMDSQQAYRELAVEVMQLRGQAHVDEQG